jgi:hypothetical protein
MAPIAWIFWPITTKRQQDPHPGRKFQLRSGHFNFSIGEQY